VLRETRPSHDALVAREVRFADPCWSNTSPFGELWVHVRGDVKPQLWDRADTG
jgi:hypothetical protein